MRRVLMILVDGRRRRANRAWADDQPKEKKESPAAVLESLTKAFGTAQNQFIEQINASAEAAKKSGSPPRPVTYEDGPGPLFSPRFLVLAGKTWAAQSAFGDCILAINSSGGPTSKAGTWSTAMTLLKDHYASRPEIKPLLRPLGTSNDDDAENLLREVIARNPDRKLQALACKSLADGRDMIGDMVDQLQAERHPAPKFRVGARQRVRRQADRRRRRTTERSRRAPKRRSREKYADVMPDVSVGKPAPEIVHPGSRRQGGKAVRLEGQGRRPRHLGHLVPAMPRA